MKALVLEECLWDMIKNLGKFCRPWRMFGVLNNEYMKERSVISYKWLSEKDMMKLVK